MMRWTRCGVVWLLLLGVPLGGVCAEPPEEEPPAESAADRATVDFMPRVTAILEEMQAYTEPPIDEGPGRVLYLAWKSDIKTRSRGLVTRAKELTRESYWDFDEQEGGATRVTPKQWGPFVRKVASLYTQLGAVWKNYGKDRISPDRAIRIWDKEHPEPRLTGLTPAGQTLLRLRRRIQYLRAQGLPVPRRLFYEIDRYVILQSEEIELRREAHRRWLEDRRLAHEEIRARYAEARVLISDQRARLAEQMKTLRVLMSDLQRVEEDRLRSLLPGFPEEDPVHASARKWLEKMVQGRQAALRFNKERTSGYGAMLNQKWTAPRTHLRTAMKKADKRRQEAAEAAQAPEEDADSAGGTEPEPAAPEPAAPEPAADDK